ncbi:unnamed protein product [Pylaiella littoralis]
MVDYADSTPLIRDPLPPHVDINRLYREAPCGGPAGGGANGSTSEAGGGADYTKTAGVTTTPAAAASLRAERQRGFVERVRHFLERLRVLQRPKVNRLFHPSAVDAKSLRADPIMSRQYLGLDWESHGHWDEPFFFVQIADPQLGMVKADGPVGGAVWEIESERLARVVGIVNRLRPKFLLVTGDMTHAPPGHEFYEGQVVAARQLLGKVSETIPVLYCPGNHDLGDAAGGTDDESDYVRRFGADYYSFWCGGVRGLVLNTHLWASASANPERRRAQERWLDQELEVAQLNAHHLIVIGHHPWFLEDPHEEVHPIWTPIPRDTRLRWLAKMGHCKVKFLLSGHCHRNYQARVRRPIVPNTPPRSTAAAAPLASAATTTTAAHAASGGEALLPPRDDSGDAGLLPSSSSSLSPGRALLSAPAADGGINASGNSIGNGPSSSSVAAAAAAAAAPRGLDSRRCEAEAEGEGKEAGVSTETAEREARAGGDVDSEDAPGSISDDDEDEDTDTSEEIDMRSVVTSSCTAPLGPDPPGFRVVRVLSRRIEHEYYDLESPPQEVDLGGEG